ncbi:uncharacterized protein PHALS_05737 [Plasmopara halstedii]|uniref:Uncharacterized protein n=1 Tax=Plasmopara halstedii TaxID=4781 RepID=A0A0P1AAB8_PLAHL|nr:uncharacterized protein PHALS_05737 [Plasmopara halstedii]CEG37678.1 hypothetical protein PHALS_05737 [Plasmopara halstedii]|eukprot:XP_024574047.1 hypothetical protein PHALS_05737 [Plasmopara halstedii]
MNSSGSHLARTVTHSHKYGYWRFPENHLDYSEVVDAIRGETQRVLTHLDTSNVREQ